MDRFIKIRDGVSNNIKLVFGFALLHNLINILFNKKYSKDTYKYYFKVGGKVVYVGITQDLSKAEKRHQVGWPKGYIQQIGKRTTFEDAVKWQDEKCSLRS